MRTAVAFLVAPLTVAIGGPLLAQISSQHKDSLLILLVEIAATYIYGLLFALVFALPLFVLLRRFGWANAYTAAGAGLMAGLLGGVIVFNGNVSPERVVSLAELSVLGALAGVVFWLIARVDMRSKPSLEQP
jgi:hypothetical protein